MSGFSLMTVGFWIASAGPPCVPDDRPILKQIADSGIVVQGRDPFKNTGLCGGLLPVHEPNDVHYLTLPRDFTQADIRSLRHFPNLEQVRCNAILSESEYELIRDCVPEDASVLCRIRGDDGVLRFGSPPRALGRFNHEDHNGDGVVDEYDLMVDAIDDEDSRQDKRSTVPRPPSHPSTPIE